MENEVRARGGAEYWGDPVTWVGKRGWLAEKPKRGTVKE